MLYYVIPSLILLIKVVYKKKKCCLVLNNVHCIVYSFASTEHSDGFDSVHRTLYSVHCIHYNE